MCVQAQLLLRPFKKLFCLKRSWRFILKLHKEITRANPPPTKIMTLFQDKLQQTFFAHTNFPQLCNKSRVLHTKVRWEQKWMQYIFQNTPTWWKCMFLVIKINLHLNPLAQANIYFTVKVALINVCRARFTIWKRFLEFVKLRFSKKATKVWKILPLVLTLLSKRQNNVLTLWVFSKEEYLLFTIVF